jgi:hypothetical protein
MSRNELHLGMAAFAIVLLLSVTAHMLTPKPLPDAEDIFATPVEEVAETVEPISPVTFIRKAIGRKEAKLPAIVVRRRAVAAKYRKPRRATGWAARVKVQNRIRTEDYRTIYPEGVNADFGRHGR